MTARWRLLVAVLLEGEAATEVDGLRRGLGGPISRVPPHVTLVAPTNLREQDTAAVLAHLGDLAGGARPFEAALGPPATFAPERPVLYLEVSGATDELDHLRRGAASGALAPPPSREERPFVPHVTLTSRIAPELVAPALALLASYRRVVRFSRLHLLEQDLEAPGRPWRVVTGMLLGGVSVSGRGGRELELTVSDHLDPDAAAWAEAAWDGYSRTAYGPGWRRDRPFGIVARERASGHAGPGRGRVLGVASGELCGRVCECERLVVDPVARGAGVGSRLVRHVERLAAERGCTTVRLRTLSDGPARRFYEARGFVASVVLPEWREGREFVVMVRAVPPT